MTFSEKLMELRKRGGWSQEQLADRLGVTRQSVSKWESGTATPELGKLVSLSELFDVSVDYLVKDYLEEEPQRHQKEMPDTARLEAKVDRLTRQMDRTVYRYTSRRKLFGLPLVDIRFSHDRHPSRNSTAIGIVAIGNFSIGVVSIGIISLGLLSVGMISLGLLLALGGVSVGTLALGASAVGIYAFGASAVGVQLGIGTAAAGKVAIGVDASGSHAMCLAGNSLEDAERFLQQYGADLWKPIRALALWILRITAG